MTQDIAPDVVERMVVLIRAMTPPNWDVTNIDWSAKNYSVARQIAALLPEPRDPDEVEAREIVILATMEDDAEISRSEAEMDTKFGSFPVNVALKAIKRGRELQREDGL